MSESSQGYPTRESRQSLVRLSFRESWTCPSALRQAGVLDRDQCVWVWRAVPMPALRDIPVQRRSLGCRRNGSISKKKHKQPTQTLTGSSSGWTWAILRRRFILQHWRYTCSFTITGWCLELLLENYFFTWWLLCQCVSEYIVHRFVIPEEFSGVCGTLSHIYLYSASQFHNSQCAEKSWCHYL